MTDDFEAERQYLLERWMALQVTHADLDAHIDHLESAQRPPADDLMLRRLKKQRLAIKDRICHWQTLLQPREPA
ncbi:MAG: YdcH family protein [Limnohabitans sp.]